MAGAGEDGAGSAAYGRAMRTEELTDAKAAARAMWALGDYHRFATQLVWEVGPVVVGAAGIGPGTRVLDVAAGTGNVAVRAAEAGAEVVASDLTPENLAAGRAAAAARGIELEWVEADAEALPFADGAFDVVTSAFGVMFAPDHRVGSARAAAGVPPRGHDRAGELRTRTAWRATSSPRSGATRRRRRASCRCSGAPRSTCASCSAMRSPRCAASADATSRPSRAVRPTMRPSSPRPSGR